MKKQKLPLIKKSTLEELSKYPIYNEGKKYDEGKLRMDLLPFEALEAVAKILTFGADKYGDNTWQKVPEAKRRYTAALLRHLSKHQCGEYLDPESGLPHLDHVLCNAMFLVWLDRKVKNEDN